MNILTKVAAWAGITFTRNSAASRQDGSQVAANAPRLETGAFGSAMMIEEGTTNLCLMDTETSAANNWTSDATAETIAISSAVSFSGAKSLAYTYGGTGSSNIHLSGTAKFTQTTATAFTASFKVKYANGSPVTGLSGYLYVSNNSNVNGPCTITQLRDGWYLCTYTRTGLAAGAVSLIGLYGLPTNTTVYIDDWQVEARSFATSYVFGTRPAELCSISTVGLLAGMDPFTIEAWVMPILPQVGSVAAIVSDWTKMYLAINSAGGLRISWTEGVQKILDSSSAPFQAGRRCHVAVTYDGLYIAGYVNGVQVIPTTQAVLGEQWSGTLKIGNLNSSYLLNGLIEDLRISSVARSAADLAARARRHNYLDASTSVVLALAGSGYLLKRDNNSVLLADPPLRESSEQQEIPQASGHDSDGAVYVYDKGVFRRVDHSMVYGQIPSYTLGLLKTFLAVTVRGSRDLFTWIDHKTAPHTVRFASRMTSADRFNDLSRVAIDLEEQISMPVPAAGTFAQMLARKTGVAPVWILKMTVNAVDYYLSDCTVTVNVGGWNATTRPWISRWGDLREGVTNALGEIRISDLDLDVIIDPAASPNMEDLATGYPLEKSPVSLFLWFTGCTEAPREMFRGYVRDVDIPDDTAVSLAIESEVSRLVNTYIGTRVDTATYPTADPDHVGRVIPIVYGTVVKLPALCVDAGWVTSLTADITFDQTSIPVSGLPSYSLVNRVITIDAEKMTISSASGTTLYVTRGSSGTAAQAHDKGSVVIEVKATPLVYLLADHAVDSIGEVYTRIQGVDIDITAECTKYLGTVGNQHASYPGKACLTIANLPAIEKKISLALLELGHNHNSATSTSQTTNLSLPTPLVYYGSYPQPSGYPYSPGLCFYKNVTFQYIAGTRSSCSYSVTINPTTTRTSRIMIVVAGVCKWWANVSLVSGSPMTITFTADAGSEANADSFHIVQIGAGAGSYFNVTAASRQVYLSSVPSTYATTGASLSGNSVADVMVGEMVLANVTRSLAINYVFDDLLSRAGMAEPLTVSGDTTEWELTAGVAGSGEVVGAELVTNGAFSTGSNWTLPTTPVELVTNGGFATDTNWTKNGATISGGTLNVNVGVASQVASQALADLTIGDTYRVTYDITTRTSGAAKVQLWNSDPVGDSFHATTGTFTYTFVAESPGTATIVVFTDSAGFVGSIDNISLKKVVNGTASISSGVLNASFASAGGLIASQTLANLAIGDTYRFSYQIASRSSGSVSAGIMESSSVTDQPHSATGTITYDFTATSPGTATVAINAGPAGFVGTIDNVSLKHVTPAVPAVPAVTYSLSGAITEYQPAIEWLNSLAFQLRSWFRVIGGVPTLIIRPDVLTSTRTISACGMTGDGKRRHKRKKGSLSDVINRISLAYDRDWTLSGDDAYRKMVADSDSASIADLGEYERPELFRFDFVTSQLQAESLLGFYLGYYSVRRWHHETDLFLDNADIVWGTCVTLGFAPGDPVGTVIEVGPAPGGARQIDKVKITVET